jgi:hypothetical protein
MAGRLILLETSVCTVRISHWIAIHSYVNEAAKSSSLSAVSVFKGPDPRLAVFK